MKIDFDMYRIYINDNYLSKYNSIFLNFMKNYFFNDNYQFKTVLRVFTDLHQYSIQNVNSEKEYLDNINFYSQAILASNEDYDIVKIFLKQLQIADSFKEF